MSFKIEKWEMHYYIQMMLFIISGFWIAEYLRPIIEQKFPINTFWLGIITIIVIMYFFKGGMKFWRIG